MSRVQESTGKRYPKSPRKVPFNFNFLSQESLMRKSSFNDELDAGSFVDDLFNHKVSVKIRNAAIKSMFIQGMATGTLVAEAYGGYMVQDAAYCFKSVEALDYAAQQMQTQGKPEFSLLYRMQSKSYKGYNQDFVKTWKLKNADSMVMGPAAEMYVGYESSLSRKDPKYLCIAMLPCTMLWPWIAGKLISSVAETNPYYSWFEVNKPDPNHKSRLVKFVNSFFGPDEMAKCQDIFNEGMVNELNFFRDACDETLFYYSFFNE